MDENALNSFFSTLEISAKKRNITFDHILYTEKIESPMEKNRHFLMSKAKHTDDLLSLNTKHTKFFFTFKTDDTEQTEYSQKNEHHQILLQHRQF